MPQADRSDRREVFLGVRGNPLSGGSSVRLVTIVIRALLRFVGRSMLMRRGVSGLHCERRDATQGGRVGALLESWIRHALDTGRMGRYEEGDGRLATTCPPTLP